ncbi:DMT family transporter [Nocardia sp. alder85J]|uniref:DMT family transporter n=1 Tax=Nocardia sp. alder85J TaxID=2862949 RepID=UPI001CD22A2F|nr:DMT family transporter [Nocardia sp. alder85J]MCX4095399.1 DMT family transporter [Nocardia sp. alder85J]
MTSATDSTARRMRSGLTYALVSAAAFGLSGVLARGLIDAGWSAGSAVTARVAVAAAVLLPIAAAQLRGERKLLRRNISLIGGYGLIAVAGTQLAFFEAVARLPVGVALLIVFASPIAVVGWMWLRHHHRPTRLTAAGTALGVAGLILVVGAGSGTAVSWSGIAWALAAMLGSLVYYLLPAEGGDDLPGTVLAASGLVIGLAALAAAGATGLVTLRWSAAPVHFRDLACPWWSVILILGTVTTALAYVSGIAATRLLGPRLASFTGLCEVAAAPLLAWALLGQSVRPLQFLGGTLILAGILAVRHGEPDFRPVQ